MKLFRLCAALSLLALLSACAATGPKLTEIKSAIPAVKPDQGRIYFYRTSSVLGAAIQASIRLNGDVVGDSMRGGFFFVDRAPGSMEVSTTTEVERKLTFTLEAGQTRYVRTAVGFGLAVGRVYPELVDNATGEMELVDLSYTGPPLNRP